MALVGAPTTRAHIPSAAEANLRKAFLDNYGTLSKKKFYERLYNCTPSDKAIERDAVYAGYTTYAVKPEGDAPAYDSGQEAWNQSYRPRSFALGVQVTKEAKQDDIHGVIKWLTAMGGGLAQVAYYTKERDAMDLFNSLLTSGTVYTANATAYSLLSTSHYRVDNGTWANRPTSDLDLSVEAVEFMIGHWAVNQVNQRGQVTMTVPKTLMVGASDWALARRIVGTRGRRPQSGADADINALDDYDLEQFMHPLLTNDGRWLVFGEKEQTGLVYIERYDPNIERWPDADNGNERLVGFYREAHGATHPQNVWGSP